MTAQPHALVCFRRAIGRRAFCLARGRRQETCGIGEQSPPQPRLAAIDAGSRRSLDGSPTWSSYDDSHLARDTQPPASNELSIPSNQDSYVLSHSISVGFTQDSRRRARSGSLSRRPCRERRTAPLRLELPQCESSDSEPPIPAARAHTDLTPARRRGCGARVDVRARHRRGL